MSRTFRVYNKIVKKCQRYNITDDIAVVHGLPFHPFASWLCMGRCPQCRDPKREPRHLRRVQKREFCRNIEEEKDL